MMKDWEKAEVGTIGNTHEIIWWERKDSKFDDKLELGRADSMDGKDWYVEQKKLGKKNFKTKSQALAYARSYMRSH